MDTRLLGVLRPAPEDRPRSRPGLRLGVTAALTAVVVLATVLTTGLATTLPATAGTASRTSAARTQVQSYPAMAPSTYEKRVQFWVNQRRANHHLSRLRFARCTDSSAERWSSHLARNDAFYHQSMSKLLDRCNASYAGETLGRGAIRPRRLVKMWMRSDGHRHVLMSSQSRRIGIGAKPDAHGRWVVAANFMRF